jgi:hypothetical protein
LSTLDTAAKDLVERRGSACVATVRADGTPGWHRSDISRCGRTTGSFFPTAMSPESRPDLLLQPAISILVQDGKQRHARRFRGTARLLMSGPTFDRLLQFYRRRGVKGAVGHMVLVDVEDVSSVNGSTSD